MTTYSVEVESDVTTSWLPMTTTFTEPTGCGPLPRQVEIDYLAYDPGYGTFDTDKQSCLPTQFTSWLEASQNRGLGPFTCPDMWTTVMTSRQDSTNVYAMCCPSDFQRNTGLSFRLYGGGSAVQTDVTIQGAIYSPYSVGCVTSLTSGYVITYRDPSTIATSTLAAPAYMWAKALVGLNKVNVSSTSISSTSSSASTATSALSASSSGSLPSGAKIGIGVGTAIFSIIIIVLIVALVCVLRRKRHVTRQLYQSNMDRGNFYDPNDRIRFQQKSELDSRLIPRPPVELEGSTATSLHKHEAQSTEN